MVDIGARPFPCRHGTHQGWNRCRRPPGGFRRRARPWPCACDAARATCALHRPRGSPALAAVPPAGSVILKNGNGLIRPVRGFPRRTGWVMAPASRDGRHRQPGRACCLRWIRSSRFRSAIHLHGSAAHRESGAVSGARARAARGGAHQGKHDHAPGRPRVAAGARTDGETLCTASGAGTAWARSAARFRSARRGARWAAASSSAKGNQRPRPRGSRPAWLRARPQRAGNDCDASSLQRSRP